MVHHQLQSTGAGILFLFLGGIFVLNYSYVEANNRDLFNYNFNDESIPGGRSYGQQNWGSVTCDSLPYCVSLMIKEVSWPCCLCLWVSVAHDTRTPYMLIKSLILLHFSGASSFSTAGRLGEQISIRERLLNFRSKQLSMVCWRWTTKLRLTSTITNRLETRQSHSWTQ